MNKTLRFLIAGLTLVLLGLLIGFQLRGSRGGMIVSGGGSGVGKLEELLSFIEANYVEEKDENVLIENAINGVMDGLDPHSFYIPASQATAMEEQLEGGFDGIGIIFTVLKDTIYVERPLPESPSLKLGILPGDRIVAVNDEVVAGIGIEHEDVLEKLKGHSGSDVKLSILRRGTPELLDFEITRARIPVSSIEFSYMMNLETGYIKVTRFTEHTYQEFREALLGLKESGMQNLVLDLRGNPGGYMNMANKIADEFLTSGQLIVSTIGRNPASRQEYEATASIGAFEHGPLIVLIDYNSASASEIVAGAVQDHDRGLIVGVRSFGKGLVQVPRTFDDHSAIRLVISKYYTPSGRCIQKPYDQGEEAYDADILNRFESGELFDESKVEVPDSLMYETDAGRPVYGGGGIYPDAFVPLDTTGNSEYLNALLRNDLFRLFSFEYVDQNVGLVAQYSSVEDYLSSFRVTPGILQRFIRFAESEGVPYDAEGYRLSKALIDNRLSAYIGRHLFSSDEAFYPIMHSIDNQLQEAKGLLPVAAELEGSGKVNLALRR